MRWRCLAPSACQQDGSHQRIARPDGDGRTWISVSPRCTSCTPYSTRLRPNAARKKTCAGRFAVKARMAGRNASILAPSAAASSPLPVRSESAPHSVLLMSVRPRPIARQLAELGRGKPPPGQPGLGEHGPELVARPGIGQAEPRRDRARGTAAEQRHHAGLDAVGKDRRPPPALRLRGHGRSRCPCRRPR